MNLSPGTVEKEMSSVVAVLNAAPFLEMSTASFFHGDA
jgi:hypothetical protein